VWNGGTSNEADLLGSCYTSSLNIALAHNLKIVAFPNISTGIYRFPKDLAARIAIDTTRSFPEAASFDKIIFVCFDIENYNLYNEMLK
jgi:O-acetyl-ADP-ribose deacetylase (regulator of RNase III)